MWTIRFALLVLMGRYGAARGPRGRTIHAKKTMTAERCARTALGAGERIGPV
jgi:hypothetical protein